MPVALFTRTVANYPRTGSNAQEGYALIRYENVQGAFSLTSLTFQDLPQPVSPFPSGTFRLFGCAWRGMTVIKQFPSNMDAFGRSIPRRRYGYYSVGYADLYSSLRYINFDKQLTEYYSMFALNGDFPSWAENFPPPFLPPDVIQSGSAIFGLSTQGRTYASQIKGEFALGVVADIFISALYSWQFYTNEQSLLLVDA